MIEEEKFKIENQEYLEENDFVASKKGILDCDGNECEISYGWYMSPQEYNVISTDYDKYIVVYSCQDYIFGSISASFVWVLGKE